MDYPVLKKNLIETFSEDYLTEVAVESEFCKRGTKFTPFMFIDILLFNASCDANRSLNQITVEILSEHDVHITKQGIDKRFTEQAVSFIKAVFEKYMVSKILNASIDAGWLAHFSQVRIKDGTRFDVPGEFSDKLPGSGGSASKAGVCIQYEFDLKSGKILDLTITPANRPDVTDAKETKGKVEEGDLLIRDLGYFVLESFAHAIQSRASLISRLDAKTCVYQERNGKLEKLDFDAIYQYMASNKLSRIEKDVIVGQKAQLPLRLIIELMPEEVFSKRMRKVNKGNKKKGYHTSEEYSKRARFNLLVTNIPEGTIPAQAISALYKLRWQVELVFKIWKSTFGIDNTRKMKYHRWLCLLYAKLLAIVINWGIVMCLRVSFYNQQRKLLSIDKCFKTLKDNMDKFRKAIRGGAKAIEKLMSWMTNTFTQNHWLERKKNKMCYEEILYLMFCKPEIYVYF